MGYLYKIRHKINGKIYIGQTIRPIQERLEEHRKGTSSNCRLIYRSIKKYGWDNFDIDWYECPDEDLNDHEKFLVKVLGTLTPNGYNLKEGGGNGKLSEETKQKIGDGNRGKNHSDEHKKNNREAKLGEKNPRYGITGEKHPRSKRVYQYDLDGIFIESFVSCEEAAQHVEGGKSNINKCASGKYKRKTAYDFKWSYIMDIFI
jgi:group I intron endonuclease